MTNADQSSVVSETVPKRGGFQGWLLKLGIAIAGAVASAIFAFFQGDITVHVASMVITGPVNGEWLMASWALADPPKSGFERSCEAVTLRQFMLRVIGDSHTTKKKWTFTGFYNQPYLALSNVSASGTSGLGTFAGRRVAEGEFAFVGEQTAINCKGNNLEPVLLRCPAILVRSDHQELIAKYGASLSASGCKEIAIDGAAAQVCKVSPKAPDSEKPRTSC